ncbi:MAG: hypothetical protein FWB75_06730 [Oscillospiraceae bacterium]|nr:hypothetical protein [Oscillospiraceae bacterium]
MSVKIVLFLILSVFAFFVMATPPEAFGFGQNSYAAYAGGVYSVVIALGALFAIDSAILRKRDYLIAVVLGVFALNLGIFGIHFAQAGLHTFGSAWFRLGIAIGVSTSLSYLAAVSLLNKSASNQKILMWTDFKPRELMIDVGIILGITFIMVTIALNQNATFSLTMFAVLSAFAPAVHEETVFRLLLFALMIKLNGDRAVPMPMMVLILSLPFALMHFIDLTMNYGFVLAMQQGMGHFLFISVVISVLMLKRSWLVALFAHYVFGFVRLTFLASGG